VGRDRPRLLADDDADYQARMTDLRQWLRRFDPKTSPTPKPLPAPPSGLAPGETEWMYNPSGDPAQRMPAEVCGLLERMAPCRDVKCAVPQRHPYYHAEVLTEAGDSYGMRVPCMPVVPVLTNRQQLFVMGDYPTAKFAARSTNNLPVLSDRGASVDRANASLEALLGDAAAQPGADSQMLETYREELADIVRRAYGRPDQDDAAAAHGQGHHVALESTPSRKNEFFVPVADVFAPMQDANYFDGYKVRNVAAGVFMQQHYLKPLGVDIDRQVWLTNMIKCFLFHPSMAASYQALGWTDVKVEASYDQLLPVAQVCSQWIDQEVKVCDPRLVLTVGKPPCTLLHGLATSSAVVQGRAYNALMGQMLKAGDRTAETNIAKNLKLEDRGQPVSILRGGPWGDYNVIHLLHPQAVMMSQTGALAGVMAAIQAQLGPKAMRMDGAQLKQAAGAYVARHGTEALIRALPYGQRDQFTANREMLQIHAVTMANLADVLLQLRLVKGTDGRQVLQAQARELAQTYLLAKDPSQELRTLQALRQETNEYFARLAH